jgi:aspartate kinase
MLSLQTDANRNDADMILRGWESGQRAWPPPGSASGRNGDARFDDLIVRKYGGSSLATFEHMQRVATSLAAAHFESGPMVVVVSARGSITDELLALVAESGGVRADRETDQLLATGECESAALMAIALRKRGVPATSMTGAQAGIRAVGKHGEGIISHVDSERMLGKLNNGTTVVVAGFQGVKDNGDVITLGRGGSDTTAVALAAQLCARRCEIYTDVAGVYTSDPRVVADARLLPKIDVGVMAELAFAGARILHSRAVELAAMHAVDVVVRGSFAKSQGTVIVGRNDGKMLETDSVVVGIAHDEDVARILVQVGARQSDAAAEVLLLLARNSVPVDLVARSGPYESETRMGFTVRRSDLGEFHGSLKQYVEAVGGYLHIDDYVGKVSLVGMGLLNRPEYTARLLMALSRAQIATSWISTSQLRASVVIPLNRLAEAVLLLHREFGLANAARGTQLTLVPEERAGEV